MELLLTRHFEFSDTPGTPLTPETKSRAPMQRGPATIGTLQIDGVQFCHTLEDIQRVKKVHGKTAIPTGRYDVTLSHSPRFSASYAAKGRGANLPRLHGVQGFEGVLIHIGNFSIDTEGCILVGSWQRSYRNMIGNSVNTYKKLHAKLSESKTPVRITIQNYVGIVDEVLKHPPKNLFDSLFNSDHTAIA
jgi:hypothetical protein